MNNIIKPGISLFIITLIAAALLGGVNYATKDVIKANNDAAKRESMQKVLPNVFEGNFSEDISVEGESNILSYNTGFDEGGNACGYVFTVNVSGYAGRFELLVGIGIDGKVTGIALGTNSETPGLGKNAEKDSFTGQFIGRSAALSVVKQPTENNNEVQAVTAATITSKAVTDGVNDVILYFDANLRGVQK